MLLTGDTHSHLSRLLERINEASMEESDTMVVMGDFGFIWITEYDQQEIDSLNILSNTCPGMLLFVDGNHENFDVLDKLPEVDYGGSKAGYIRENILHLKRGRIYDIEGKKCLAMGGALSHDKHCRKEGESWWPQEEPSDLNWATCFKSLRDNNMHVDYIFTHSAPESFVRTLCLLKGIPLFEIDRTARMLEYLKNRVKFDKWFCGHWHYTHRIDNIYCLYYEVLQV